jgi:PiT family inorganic phosphate transporter
LGILLGIADLLMSILISLAIALIIILLSYYLLRNVQEKTQDDYATVEGIFRKLQIITSCYVAFSIGSNDVANAIGPIAAIVPLASDGTIGTVAEIPVYLLLIGASGMALGCLIWGYRVMKTMGSRITKLTNTRGFSVDFGGATTVLIASKLGLPISTSHTAVGAIIGVGLARGLEAIDLKVIRKIVISWLLTLPIAATTSAIIFIGLITLI